VWERVLSSELANDRVTVTEMSGLRQGLICARQQVLPFGTPPVKTFSIRDYVHVCDLADAHACAVRARCYRPDTELSSTALHRYIAPPAKPRRNCKRGSPGFC
jgi:hypothetical protein